MTQPTPEELWERFIAELNAQLPLNKGKTPHTNFLGSIAFYKKIFLQANKDANEA